MANFWRIITVFVSLSYCCTNVASHARYQRANSGQEHNDLLNTAKEKVVNVKKVIPEETTLASKGAPCSGCPGHSSCVALVQCPAHVRSRGGARCHLPRGREGICCSTGQNHTDLSAADDLKARHSVLDAKSVKDATVKARLRLNRLMEKEKEIIDAARHKTIVPRGTPTFGHFQSQRSINYKESSKIGQEALQNLFALQALKELDDIPDDDILLERNKIKLDEPPCQPEPPCSKHILSKYRTLDGTCNNMARTTWGAARTAMERLLPPHYDDGIWSPRGSSTPLCPARAASAKMILDKDRPHSRATILTMQFGQFIAHDISSSVTLTFGNGSAISCCSEGGASVLPPELLHFACYPIELASEDHFYGQYGHKCMNFVRTQLAPNHDCSLSYAKQMNGVTHFLDLSQVYGSHPDTLGPLREWSGGRMKMFNDFGRDLLPLSEDKNDCITMEQGSACFKSGDGHANQMISLVAVHMVFTREHNRVAGILCELNPHWSDQLVFLEARKIVIAEFQHVVFNEYLPLVIGEAAMDEFGLNPRHGFSHDYDMHTNPSLTNEFSVAAFRFGHSTVDAKLKIPKGMEIDEVILIPEVMFHPARMRVREFFDRILIGLTSQPMQETDPSLTVQLTQYLFRGGNPHGIDLASLNIQRGRDHGLRCYNDYRELVGLPKIEHFEDFGHSIADHIGGAYDSPYDIDLWLGGLLESPDDDALVGYTFREIIADQFSRLRKGDRYFYEHGPLTNPGHFTLAQLSEIKKTSMSRLICDNSDHIELHYQSPRAFLRPDIPGNEALPCHELPYVDFSPWKEH